MDPFLKLKANVVLHYCNVFKSLSIICIRIH